MSKELAIKQLETAFSADQQYEAEAQRVLEKYWWLLLIRLARYPKEYQGVYTQVPIGIGDKEYVPDFMSFHNIRAFTAFTTWRLIELEPPASKLLNKDGSISKTLKRAYEQILEWHSWLRRYHTPRGDLFWADNDIIFEYCIYISRRSLAGLEEWKRIPALISANQHIKLKLHTYDSLIELAESMDELTWDWFESQSFSILKANDFKNRMEIIYDNREDKLVATRNWSAR